MSRRRCAPTDSSPSSQVPIPTNGALLVGFSTPTPPSGGSVSVDSARATCGDPQSGCLVEVSPNQIGEQLHDALTPTVALGTP